jgi:8-amino-3,8-dideoxy-alpha-D-manno-octulosonate transaminase
MPGWELLGKEEREAVNDIFDKSNGVLYRYGLDAIRNNIFRVNEFEKAIAEKLEVKHALFVSSGTAALKLALLALGIKPGDEVITQSFTFIATVEAILDIGAIPIITEIDESLNMDPKDLEKKITNKTKAIIPVHMLGVSAKMDKILSIAKKFKIPVLEDSAQALGGTYKGKLLGTLGDIGIYSLDIGKVITTGEGGVIVTNNEDLFRKCLEYSDHGHECNPNFPRGEDTRTRWGFNYKVTELHGAIGLAQLKKLDYILSKQKENKNKIKIAISDIPNIKFREIPDIEGDAGDTLVFFLENEEKAKKFAQLLKEKGIGTKNMPDAIDWHYAGTWGHIFKDFPEYYKKNLEEVWPNSTFIVRRAVSIPIMVNMPEERIEKIISSVKEIFEDLNSLPQ